MLLAASLLSAVGFAAPTFEHLDTFLYGAYGRAPESCAYDTVNDRWILDNIASGMGEIDALPGSYPLTPLSDGDVTELGVTEAMAPLGMIFGADNSLYIANYAPTELIRFDTATGMVNMTWDLTLESGQAIGANGLCYDANTDTLFASNVGIDFFTNDSIPEYLVGAIHIIRGISTASPDITTLSMEDVMDQNGNSYGPYYPNGCTVVNGMVYWVEFRLDFTGALGVLDPSDDSFYANTDIAGLGDGLINIGNYLILSRWDSFNVSERAGSLRYYDLNNYPNGDFVLGIGDLGNPADIAYQPSTGIICVPAVDSATVDFIQFSADNVPTFENVGQFTGLSEAPGTTESCAYDRINDKWLFVASDPLPLALAGTGTVQSLPGSYPETALSDGDWMEEVDITLSFTTGVLFVADNSLYMAQYNPSVIGLFNTEDGTASVVDKIDIPTIGDTTFGANGLCYDEDMDTLYITNMGLDFFGLSNGSDVIGPSLTKVVGLMTDAPTVTAMDLSTVEDQEGNSWTGAYFPNGCTVAKGMVFLTGGAGLGVYDPSANSFVVNTNIPADGDGLITIGNFLVLSSWGSAGYGYLAYYDLDNYPNGEFKFGIGGLATPADIAYQPSTGIICVPSLMTGTIDFIKFAPNAPTMEPTESPTTMEPTESPTMEPTEDMTMMTTMEDGESGDGANYMSMLVAVVATVFTVCFL